MAKTFKILSLNGGGVRAIFQAHYLDRVSAMEGIGDFWKRCDLIIGTSAGALVATALCNGMTPSDIAQLIVKDGRKAFPRGKAVWIGIRMKFKMPKRGAALPNDRLRGLLIDRFGADTLLGKFEKPMLAVTATQLTGSKVRVFTPLHDLNGKSVQPDGSLNLIEVLMASTALPGVFPPVLVTGDEGYFIDGGIWSNAPLLAAVVLANERAGQPMSGIRVVSIGTASKPYSPTAAQHNDLRGATPKFYEHLFNVATSAAEHLSGEAVERLIGGDNVVYVDDESLDYIEPWKTRKALDELPPAAERIANDRAMTAKLERLMA